MFQQIYVFDHCDNVEGILSFRIADIASFYRSSDSAYVMLRIRGGSQSHYRVKYQDLKELIEQKKR